MKRLTATLPDWRLQESGARARIGPGRARDACDRLLYVSAHISAPEGQQAEAPQSVFAHWRSAEAWYRDDPSDTRRSHDPPVLFSAARTSPRRDVTVVSLVSLSLSSCCCVLNFACLGKRSRLCRRATDEEYPGRRRTKGAGRRGQPSPAPSFFSAPHCCLLPVCLLQAAGFRVLGGVSFARQSASLAPAGISPRSR